jgi:16S rRNA (uracil1498-N3)-methyltransferase
VHARFYAPDASAPGGVVSLPRDEAEHLSRVLRLSAGDAIRVFNGRGDEFDGVIAGVHRRAVSVEIGAKRQATPELSVPITLAAAVLKADTMDTVIRDAVMLGAAGIQPIVAARTGTTLAALERGRRRDRWERVAIASTKQCGRAVLTGVRAPCTFDALVTALGEAPAGVAFLFVEPDAPGRASPLAALPSVPPPAATIVIGPEGGWSYEEIERGSRVCRVVTMRTPTIRASAMPAVAIAALLAHWELI